jgi:hypothetical protein
LGKFWTATINAEPAFAERQNVITCDWLKWQRGCQYRCALPLGDSNELESILQVFKPMA